MHIDHLLIYSSRIEEQFHFYADVIGLKVLARTEDMASFGIGSSKLTIAYQEDATPYHYAINIPSHQEIEALEWIKKRVPVLEYEGKEIQDFKFWNAKAIYFYDADMNIVEFIARKNLNHPSDQKFNQTQLLCISEIGVPSNNIEKQVDFLSGLTGITIYDGGLERFCAIGDEYGLFICINNQVKKWFPTDDVAYASDFIISFHEENSCFQVEYSNESFRLMSKLET